MFTSTIRPSDRVFFQPFSSAINRILRDRCRRHLIRRYLRNTSLAVHVFAKVSSRARARGTTLYSLRRLFENFVGPANCYAPAQCKLLQLLLTIVCNLLVKSIWQPDFALQTVTSRFGGDGGGAAGPSRPSRPSAPSRGGGGSRGGGRGGGANQGSRPPIRGGYGGGNRGNSNGSNRGRGGMRNAPEPRVIANRMIQ